MATYTSNYNLKKPAETDFYDIEDFNGNTDIIDEALNNKLETDFSNVSGGAVPIANGGTGATTAEGAKNNLGLGTSSWVKFGKTVSESIEVVSEYPYIDFSPNSQTDFEVRIAKNAANQLNIEAPNGNATLKVNGANVQTQGHIHLAGQGLYNGYSFQNEIGNDTGMFSAGDGDLQFYSNANKLMYTLDNRLVFPNGTVYVQESQPSAPDGSLWAW